MLEIEPNDYHTYPARPKISKYTHTRKYTKNKIHIISTKLYNSNIIINPHLLTPHSTYTYTHSLTLSSSTHHTCTSLKSLPPSSSTHHTYPSSPTSQSPLPYSTHTYTHTSQISHSLLYPQSTLTPKSRPLYYFYPLFIHTFSSPKQLLTTI